MSPAVCDGFVNTNPDYKDEEEDHESTENCEEYDEKEVDAVRKLFCFDGMYHSLARPFWPVSKKSFHFFHPGGVPGGVPLSVQSAPCQ